MAYGPQLLQQPFLFQKTTNPKNNFLSQFHSEAKEDVRAILAFTKLNISFIKKSPERQYN
jgi:hypothetical protein